MAMRNIYFMTVMCICLLVGHVASAQSESEDSTKVAVHSPKKAALLSAVLPGTGQIYNRKYWKAPIVYAALGTATYFYFNNRNLYLEYRNAYLNDLKAGEPGYVPSTYALQGVPATSLRTAADESRRFMEFSILGFIAIYGLQIIDATVDGHLFTFDVNEELSMTMSPLLLPSRNQKMMSGIGLNFSF